MACWHDTANLVTLKAFNAPAFGKALALPAPIIPATLVPEHAMQPNQQKRNEQNRSTTRRRFLKASLAAGAATFAAPAIVRGQNLNEKLNIGVIATGGRGGGNMNSVATENIVALCDVNEANLSRAAEKFPKARKFVDFRQLYDHANQLDAVVVSTCEHTHAFATLPALQLGKHVYCEKPLDALDLGSPGHS